jgi:hypothetical protein
MLNFCADVPAGHYESCGHRDPLIRCAVVHAATGRRNPARVRSQLWNVAAVRMARGP